MEIYADIVFIVNLIMDGLLLYSASRLLRLRTPLLRIALIAAASSGLYILSLALLGRNSLAVSELVFTLSAALCFKTKSLRALINAVVMTHICAFALGGLCTALFYFADGSFLGGILRMNADHFSLKIVLGAAALCYTALRLFMKRLANTVTAKKELLTLILKIKGTAVNYTALVDSGNELCDPVSGKPVVIAEFGGFSPNLPENLRALFVDGKPDVAVLTGIAGSLFEGRLRLIPYSSLGNDDGLLVGLVTDEVELSGESLRCPTALPRCIVGFASAPLSESGEYNALISPQLISR